MAQVVTMGEGWRAERPRDQRVGLCEESCFWVPLLLPGVLCSLLLSRVLKEVPSSEGTLVIFSAACHPEKVPVLSAVSQAVPRF